MRILKYLFLLCLLAFIGFSVHIATQKGDFEIQVSRVIKTNRATVYDYVNDYKNWESFGSWMNKNLDLQFNYDKNSIGLGASCSFETNSDTGTIKTLWTKENDSLSQKINLNNSVATIAWKFKDTLGGTKITVYSRGKMDLYTKINTFFNGGVNRVLTDFYNKSLLNLDKTVRYEMNTYFVKVNGIAQIKSGYCLQKTITCRIKNISKNTKILLAEMVLFFKKNKIISAGNPFVCYKKYDIKNDIATLSIGIPVKKQISISDGSDITSSEITPYTCVKTTMVGDYSHSKTAWKKAKEYIKANKLKENKAGSYTEIFIKTIDNVKRPSKCITEIYIPIMLIDKKVDKSKVKEKKKKEVPDEIEKTSENNEDTP